MSWRKENLILGFILGLHIPSPASFIMSLRCGRAAAEAAPRNDKTFTTGSARGWRKRQSKHEAKVISSWPCSLTATRSCQPSVSTPTGDGGAGEQGVGVIFINFLTDGRSKKGKDKQLIMQMKAIKWRDGTTAHMHARTHESTCVLTSSQKRTRRTDIQNKRRRKWWMEATLVRTDDKKGWSKGQKETKKNISEKKSLQNGREL